LETTWGLSVMLGKNIMSRHHYSAGTWQERLEDLHAFWADDKIKAIIMAVGGHTANQLLSSLDYELIRKNPKIFCGISDGTTLLNPIYTKTGLVTYHGPDVCFTFGLPMPDMIRKNMRETLFNGHVSPLSPLANFTYSEHPDKPYTGWHCLNSGKASGRLFGGHMGCLLTLLAARHITATDFNGKLLFLEGTDPVSDLDSQVWALKSAGIFDSISGLILGHFEWSQQEFQRPIADVFSEVLPHPSFPILEIGELGHCVENYCFPIGCVATVDADALSITIDEPTVKVA
jgi:muramoyltetrapeptide carboxypeptidase